MKMASRCVHRLVLWPSPSRAASILRLLRVPVSLPGSPGEFPNSVAMAQQSAYSQSARKDPVVRVRASSQAAPSSSWPWAEPFCRRARFNSLNGPHRGSQPSDKPAPAWPARRKNSRLSTSLSGFVQEKTLCLLSSRSGRGAAAFPSVRECSEKRKLHSSGSRVATFTSTTAVRGTVLGQCSSHQKVLKSQQQL